MLTLDDSVFTIEYRLTEKCNFDCEYCEFLHDNTSRNCGIDYNDINKLIDLIRARYNKPICLNLYGGEPLLHKDIGLILDNVYRDVKIEICTNLSMTIPQLQNENVFVCATYHEGGIPFTKFMQNAMSIKSNIDMIPLMYTTDKYDVDKYNILASIFGEHVVMVCPIVLYGDSLTNDPSVVPVDESDHRLEYADFFKKQLDYNGRPTSAYEMFKNKWNMFKGYKCACLRNKICIDHTGRIFKCSMDMLLDKPDIGHIEDLTSMYELEYEDTICSHKFCMYDICESGAKWN